MRDLKTGTSDTAAVHGKARTTVDLKILATSDLHMHIAPHDYYQDKPSFRYGLALTARLIAQERTNHPNCILLDNGDFLQGSPLGDFVAAKNIRPNPMIDVMNRLGYDAANIGNHEFSGGLGLLRDAVMDADFPCISANTIETATSAPLFITHAILEKMVTASDGSLHALKIGVIGVLPPQTVVWDAEVLEGKVRTLDMVEAVAALLPKVRAAGASVIIVLAHCGIGTFPDTPMAENAGLSIARLDGIDALVLGHVHLPFPGPLTDAHSAVDAVTGTLFGKPAVMPGCLGSHLGVIELRLQSCDADWEVSSFKAKVVPVDPAAPKPAEQQNSEPDLLAAIGKVHRATRRWASRPISAATQPLHTYFAMVSDTLPQQVINKAQADYVRARLHKTDLADIPVLSATAPFRAGGRAGPENFSVALPGPFRLRNAADLYIHPNSIMAFKVRGDQILDWLHQSTRIFNHISHGARDAPLTDPSVPSFLFDTIHGVTYQIDLSVEWAAQDRRRVTDLRFDGSKVCPEDQFILATNSYRGNGDFAASLQDQICLADSRMNRDVLIEFLSSQGTLPLADPPNWRFASQPETSVIFETSPLALAYLGDVGHLSLEPLSVTDAGFLQIRLHL